MASLYKKKSFMIQIVIMDLFPIGLFLNEAWILKFFSSTKLTINYSNYIIIVIGIPPKMDLLMHFTLQIFDDLINLSWAKQRISRSGEITGNSRMTNISDKSHYTSTQDASSSPGLRKGTFGTPIGMK